MAVEKLLHYVIEVQGKPRRIATVLSEKRPKAYGDLYLVMQHAELYLADLITPDETQRQIIETRYTIHRSLESEDNINALNKTLRHFDRALGRASDEKAPPGSHFTTALKKSDNFAPLLIKKCPDLSEQIYDLEDDGVKVVSLGSYDPQEFSLYLGFLVSNPKRTFINHVKGDFYRHHTAAFEFFAITLLWSFVAIPSKNVGITFDIFTKGPPHPKGHPEYVQPFMDTGLSEKQFSLFYAQGLDRVRTKYLEALVEKGVIKPAQAIMENALPFAPDCDTESPHHKMLTKRRLKQLNRRGLLKKDDLPDILSAAISGI